MFDNFVGLVLAAGQGTRIQKFTSIPKVLLKLNEKYLVQYALDHLSAMGISKKIVVVKHRKDEIIEKLDNQEVEFIEQMDLPGTGAALMTTTGFLKNLTNDSVLVLQGDDTAFLKISTLKALLVMHQESGAKITLLTTKRDDPTGFGRIIRSAVGDFMKIVEEKNTNQEEKEIKEVNTGVWVFDRKWLIDNVNLIEKNEVSGEYYATDLIEIARNNNHKIETWTCPEDEFFGINTEEQYKEAVKRKEGKI